MRGRRPTADAALRPGCYFGAVPDFRIDLWNRYDLDVAERTLRRKIEREVAPRAA